MHCEEARKLQPSVVLQHNDSMQVVVKKSTPAWSFMSVIEHISVYSSFMPYSLIFITSCHNNICCGKILCTKQCHHSSLLTYHNNYVYQSSSHVFVFISVRLTPFISLLYMFISNHMTFSPLVSCILSALLCTSM